MVDSARPLSLRPDCRHLPVYNGIEMVAPYKRGGWGLVGPGDYIHPDGSLLRHSLWRQVQNVLALYLEQADAGSVDQPWRPPRKPLEAQRSPQGVVSVQ